MPKPLILQALLIDLADAADLSSASPVLGSWDASAICIVRKFLVSADGGQLYDAFDILMVENVVRPQYRQDRQDRCDTRPLGLLKRNSGTAILISAISTMGDRVRQLRLFLLVERSREEERSCSRTSINWRRCGCGG